MRRPSLLALATLAALDLFACSSAPDATTLEPTVAGPVAPAPGGPAAVGAPTSSSEPNGVSTPAHGLRSDWFDVFADLADTRFDVPAHIDHDEATAPAKGVRGMLYSARFTGDLSVAAAGDLHLFVKSDDGVRVFLDGKVVLDDWHAHPPTDHEVKVTVTAGPHALRLDYFQGRGAATLSLEWQPPGGTRGPIPLEALTPSTTRPVDDKGTPLEGPRPTFTNPVIPFDCPDPGVAFVPGREHPRWVMACTGGAMPVRFSDDLVTWEDTGNFIIPGGKTPWSANGGRNWAPEIHAVGAGWVAYFTAVDAQNRLAIGCSYASAAEGPYTDCGESMIEDPAGVIDPTYFEDVDGKRYIYFKLDGNAYGQPTPIYVHELTADGHAVRSDSVPVSVLVNDLAWEGAVVEAPYVVKRGSYYYLFYSGNGYDARYRTGVARATSPKGPFVKMGDPVLGNSAAWVGPGHGTVITAHGADYFFHHAWPTLPDGSMDAARGRIDVVSPIRWVADWPVVGDGGVVPAGEQLWP